MFAFSIQSDEPFFDIFSNRYVRFKAYYANSGWKLQEITELELRKCN